MKIHWSKVLGITFTFSFALHLLLVSGVIAELIGAKGFYAHFSIAGWFFYLYSLTMLGASTIVAYWVKQNRFHHFFIALLMSLIINFSLYNLASMYGEIQNTKVMRQTYINDPQSRPLLDSQRPLSIIEPLVIKHNASSPITIVVHALPGVLESGKSKAEIKGDVYPPDSKAWGEGILYSSGEQTQGGRIIYTATIDFVPDSNWSSGVVIVKSESGEVTSSIIRR